MKNNFIRSSIAPGCLVLAIRFLLGPKVRGAAGGSTRTVKGNSALADQQFSVTSGGGGSVTVNGCNSPMCPIPKSCPQ